MLNTPKWPQIYLENRYKKIFEEYLIFDLDLIVYISTRSPIFASIFILYSYRKAVNHLETIGKWLLKPYLETVETPSSNGRKNHLEMVEKNI